MKDHPAVKRKPSAKPRLTDSNQIKSIFIEDFYSAALRHHVRVEVLLPPWYDEAVQFSFPLLVLNDGQMIPHLHLKESLLNCYNENAIPPLIVAGVHAHDRMQEYGVAGVPDYKRRGARADRYSRFVVNELMPLLKKNFRIMDGPEYSAIAGFSLGGLSAFDIAWNYPHIFSTAGVFSGSFWWRSKAYDAGYSDDTDRIMHKMVRATDSKSDQRFWFECGTEDEYADRNNNGVIDAIEDTLDIIKELEALGYQQGKDLRYLEIPGGHHDEHTWSVAIPDFLRWTFRH